MSCKYCKHQFCWDCGGEFHTTNVCNRSKIQTDLNPVLEFEELNQECSHYFHERQNSIKTYQSLLLLLLEKPNINNDNINVLKVKIEGWKLLSNGYSILAHSCIVRYNIKSDKMKILFMVQKTLIESLNYKLINIWEQNSFPIIEAKLMIRQLQLRLREYILSVHTEIFQEITVNEVITPKTTPNRRQNLIRNESNRSVNSNSNINNTTFIDINEELEILHSQIIFGNAFNS